MVPFLYVISFIAILVVAALTEINTYFAGIMCILCFFAIYYGDYRYNVKRKPIMHSMARVVSKHASNMRYSIDFCLANKETVWLEVSKKQFYAIKEHDVVEIKYQGWLLRSLKRAKDEDAIVNNDYGRNKL